MPRIARAILLWAAVAIAIGAPAAAAGDSFSRPLPTLAGNPPLWMVWHKVPVPASVPAPVPEPKDQAQKCECHPPAATNKGSVEPAR